MSIPEPSTASDARPVRRRRRGLVGRLLLAAALGLVVGVLGTVAHRTQWHGVPAGLVLALVVTLSTAVLCRAWSDVGALLAAGAGWVVAVQVLSLPGPGGDVLVPAQPVGMVWTYGGMLMFVVAAFLPRSWFSDQPARRGRAHRP